MADDQQEFEYAHLSNQLIALNATALGFAAGLVLGLFLFIGTLWRLFYLGETPNPGPGGGLGIAMFLSAVLPGYSISVTGALVGGVYGFALGTISGAGVGSLYNVLTGLRRRAAANQSQQ
ncbi:MAG: hypothetical protein AAF384_08830 [Pseudomonadota bacterium]